MCEPKAKAMSVELLLLEKATLGRKIGVGNIGVC